MRRPSGREDESMQGDRKKSWREVDRTRDRSAHCQDRSREQRHDETARANAAAKQYRSALEALFTPKPEAEETKPVPLPKTAARIVLPPNPDADPRNEERRRLLGKVLNASGPASISKAADAFLGAGFTFPIDQDVYVQLLEHVDEARVRDAIIQLTDIFAGELPKRRPIVEQRLRRIEDQADETATRDAAAALRRMLHGRGAGPTPAKPVQ